ncbi:hypothetical protein ACHAPU_007515 [Fusarium lateritium]
MILADPHGFGKTLVALATIVSISANPEPKSGFSLIVAPVSCIQQWMAEIDLYFRQWQPPAICLHGENKTIRPIDLWKYKIVVTSYSYLADEVMRITKFKEEMKAYKAGATSQVPKRPTIVLLSGVWNQHPRKLFGEVLVLDEAHPIRDIESPAYHAIESLRDRFPFCFMMTGTPLEITWEDGYALLSMLKGHPFTSLPIFRATFLENPSDRYAVPERRYGARYIQVLDAVSLRRPITTLEWVFRGVSEDKIIHFSLDEKERTDSNNSFAMFKKSMEDGLEYWGYLMQAQQHAYHHMLVDLPFEHAALARDMRSDQYADILGEEEPGIAKQLGEWRARLNKDKNWFSPRIARVMAVVDAHGGRHPDSSFLIADESEYFLEILEAAFKARYEPRAVHLYSRRLSPKERQSMMDTIFEIETPQIVLASRATCGQGLNFQCLNVLIRCGPWWHESWETQAEGRLCRPGQTKHVFVYELRAEGCEVENYKNMTRDNENPINSFIEGAITREDGQSGQSIISKYID